MASGAHAFCVERPNTERRRPRRRETVPPRRLLQHPVRPMKNLYMTTAMILSLGGAAFAQTATTETPADAEAPAAEVPATTETPADAAAPAAATDAPAADAAASDPGEAMQTGLLRASALEGVDIFSVDVTGTTTWSDGERYSEIDVDWEKIGEIEDLVLNGDGEIVGAIAEVGGFLGLGEKEVMIEPSEMSFVITEDRIAVVSALGREALEQREETAEEIRGDD